MELDVFTLFPEWFDWFASRSATSPTRSPAGTQLELRRTSASTRR